MSTTPAPEYISNLETLVTARTQQLKTVVMTNEQMAQALEAVTKAATLEEAQRIAQKVDNWRSPERMETHSPQASEPEKRYWYDFKDPRMMSLLLGSALRGALDLLEKGQVEDAKMVLQAGLQEMDKERLANGDQLTARFFGNRNNSSAEML
jgi:hypothetical protein